MLVIESWIPDRQPPVRSRRTSGPVVSITIICDNDDDRATMLWNMHKAQGTRRLPGSMTATPANSCWSGVGNLRFSCPLWVWSDVGASQHHLSLIANLTGVFELGPVKTRSRRAIDNLALRLLLENILVQYETLFYTWKQTGRHFTRCLLIQRAEV